VRGARGRARPPGTAPAAPPTIERTPATRSARLTQSATPLAVSSRSFHTSNSATPPSPPSRMRFSAASSSCRTKSLKCCSAPACSRTLGSTHSAPLHGELAKLKKMPNLNHEVKTPDKTLENLWMHILVIADYRTLN